MTSRMGLYAFTKMLYFIFLDLDQPFTFDICLSAVRVIYPAYTKKALRFRIREMVQKKYLEEHRIKQKIFYRCLIHKNLVSVEQTPGKRSQHLHFFLCEL